ASVPRKEDRRFLGGKGQYTDDNVLPDQTYAVFVRPPHAHAKGKKVDAKAARAHARGLAGLVHADGVADGPGGLPPGWAVKNKDGSAMVEPPHPALVDHVRHVGDAVAMVIATTPGAARAAAKLVDVDYDVLPAAARLADAIAPKAPLV